MYWQCFYGTVRDLSFDKKAHIFQGGAPQTPTPTSHLLDALGRSLSRARYLLCLDLPPSLHLPFRKSYILVVCLWLGLA